MLRVGLLTYHFSDNYGALFQAYALRKWFQARGHHAEFINYHPRYVEEGGAFDKPLDPRNWRKNATILYMKASHLRRKLLGDRRQARAFAGFRRDMLGITGPHVETAEELTSLDRFDLLVCGSDQIWSPSIQRGLDPVYFLQFAGAQRARRIAYAPSFGRSGLDAQFLEEAGRLINGLDALSVREASGIDIVRAVSGRQAVCVPDPTLLLDDFSDILATDDPGSMGHVFCYALRAGEPIRELAAQAGRELGAPILTPYNPHRRWRKIGTTIYPSPAGWLHLLNGTSLAVTNSFHGVALSIALRKPFIAATLPGSKRGLSERIRNLLEQTGLTHRLLDVPGVTAGRIIREPIDWAAVEDKLAVMRRSGEQYLDGEIAKVKSGNAP